MSLVFILIARVTGGGVPELPGLVIFLCLLALDLTLLWQWLAT